MVYKIFRLYDEFRKQIKDEKEQNKCIDDVYNSQHSIFVYMRDTMSGVIKNDILYNNAVEGMKRINEYCDKYGCERVFEYDETDFRTVVRCASNLSSSITEYSLHHKIY